MIAILPMYDWPERRAANGALWRNIRDRLRADGIEAPDALTSPGDLVSAWLSSDLLFGQTCTFPLETALAGKVRYVATPSYPAPGCEKPGHYRSAIIMRGAGDVPVPRDPGATLPDWTADARFALNGFDSMSGWHGLLRDCEAAGRAMPARHLETGSHRASIVAVAVGRADLAAIDCVSFALARDHEPTAARVRIAGWTAERPGLPLITALGTPGPVLAALRRAAAAEMDAVVLARPTER
ncbi:MAG: phosphate ABC transporter substrate-binding protein [Rhizobiaceae bacterium]|jgi:ABC-type phosphate/phosphonate transport system substrate-binding protein|nr:phosphate ABC transporter substrate-binding protein [Rhizobiaceae bacterium]